MQLTSQDKKAAREGFAYVVVRGGKRVCYASTLAEAKRECGSKGKVVSISGMRYTAQNPSLNVRNPSRVSLDDVMLKYAMGKKRLRVGSRVGGYTVTRIGTHTIEFRDRNGFDMARQIPFVTASGHMTKAYGKATRNPSLNVRNPSLNVRNPNYPNDPSQGVLEAAFLARDWHGGQGSALYRLGSGQWEHLTASDYRGAANEFERLLKSGQVDPEYDDAMHEAVSALRKYAKAIDHLEQNPRKQRNPSAAGVGHAVGKHTKYAARGAARVGKKAWAGTKSFFGGFASGYKKHNPSLNVRNPASKADIVALALAKVDKRAGQVTGEDNSIEVRAKRLRKSGYVVAGDPYGYGFPQQPKNIKAATILTEFKGGKVAPPSSSYSWSFDLNRELGNKAWEVSPINSAATLIFKW